MKKLEQFNKEFERLKGKKIENIILYIHMPTGENEVIVNSNVEEKVKYINKTYNEDLVHANCKDIYINEWLFCEEITEFDFGYALDLLKDGKKTARRGWNGKGLYIEMEKGRDYKFSDLNPFLVIKNNLNSFNTWVPSISDLMAEDWYEVE